MVRVLPVLLATGLSIQSALAWGAAGHEIVATIAQVYLHPDALEPLCLILHGTPTSTCHLAPIANWADKVRMVAGYRWSATLHYVNGLGDYPRHHCTFGEEGWAGKRGANVLAAIANSTRWLKDGKDGGDEALKFLVHFMGDVHMPLHLTGRDRGGNGDKVRFDGRQTNLHSVWDNALIAKAIRITPPKYDEPLPNMQIEDALRDSIYDPYIRQIFWEGILRTWKDEVDNWASCPIPPTTSSSRTFVQHVFGPSVPAWPGADSDDEDVCPYEWARKIQPLNCEIIWPAELDKPDEFWAPKPDLIELDTPAYSGVIYKRRIIEKLLAQAGVRLAVILNDLFVGHHGLYYGPN